MKIQNEFKKGEIQNEDDDSEETTPQENVLSPKRNEGNLGF